MAKAKKSYIEKLGDLGRKIDESDDSNKNALSIVRGYIDSLVKLALADKWHEFGQLALETRSRVFGMREVVEMCCGSAVESDSTRKAVGIKT